MFLSEKSHSKNSLRRKQTIIPTDFQKTCRGLFILFDKLEFDDYSSDCFVFDINHDMISKSLDRYVALGTVK